MSDNRAIKWLALLAAAVFVVNIYVFSRFTVDDAFITWRYGRNLVDYGVWGYNPIELDLTQAYTNPLYAALSIIPAYAELDTVLFFKLFSVFLLGIFIFLFYKKLKNKIVGFSTLTFLFASPSLTIHLFSGLETFAYAAFLGLALISLDRNEYKSASLYILLSVLCRPEAWLWTALLPITILLVEAKNDRASSAHFRINTENLTLSSLKYVLVATIPGFFLAAMLLVHKSHFGYFLPNTFYVKSASGAAFDPVTFVFISLIGIFPLIISFMAGKRIVPAVMLVYFLVVIYNYSSSDLQMNYNWRFAFQVFAPNYFYAAHVAGTEVRKFRLIATHAPFKEYAFDVSTGFAILLGFMSAMYTLQTSRAVELVHLANYYPRALNSHAALGRALYDINGKSIKTRFLLGDGGMAAFHSRAVALDNVGLGSALVAHKGITNDVLDQYRPDHVFLHANPETGVWKRFGHQQILSWMKQEGYDFVCDIFWKRDYSLRYYAKVPEPLIKNVCDSSREANYVSDRDYFVSQISHAPWFYWRE